MLACPEEGGGAVGAKRLHSWNRSGSMHGPRLGRYRWWGQRSLVNVGSQRWGWSGHGLIRVDGSRRQRCDLVEVGGGSCGHLLVLGLGHVPGSVRERVSKVSIPHSIRAILSVQAM